MRSPSSLKDEFLKKWQKGLQICRSSLKNTSVSERRMAIKLAADVAMASLRKGTTCWSRALIANNASNRLLVNRILISIQAEGLIKKIKISKSSTACHRKIIRRSKKIILKGRERRSRIDVVSMAKRIVKKRTQVLKSLVPGGELMNDEILLIQETLDYIASLRTQVEVMRSLVDAAEFGSAIRLV